MLKEHVFAEWLHPYLPIEKMPNHQSFFEHILPERPIVEFKTRSGDPHSGTLRVVCKTCNNGWMSRLQAAAQPILLPMVLGNSATLWKRQMATVAAWAAMFTMVTEWARRDPELVVTPSWDRERFAQSQKIPYGWKIWIGQYERDGWPGIFSRTTFPINNTDSPIQYGAKGAAIPNSQAVTFVVGKIVFHVLTSPVKRFTVKQKLPSNVLGQIYPLVGSPTGWPPPRR